MNRKNKILNNMKGYAILEFVFYISILVILVLVVINAIIVMTRSLKETTINTQLENGGIIMERISRSIKQASSITSVSASDLVLVTLDQNGTSENVEFVLSGSNINFLQNSVLTGNLNPVNLSVSNLSFTKITTTEGTAIKISFIVSSTNDPSNRTVDFYNTIVLRGDY